MGTVGTRSTVTQAVQATGRHRIFATCECGRFLRTAFQRRKPRASLLPRCTQLVNSRLVCLCVCVCARLSVYTRDIHLNELMCVSLSQCDVCVHIHVCVHASMCVCLSHRVCACVRLSHRVCACVPCVSVSAFMRGRGGWIKLREARVCD